MNLIEIRKFWNWFHENCQGFGTNFNNTALLDELDVWVGRLGNFSWEVGPGNVKDNALVISPNGDLELLQDTMQIVSNSTECDGWEYYYAKPAKKWDLIFDFGSTDGKVIEINAAEWEYALLKYDDGMFEIIIRSSSLNELNDSDKLIAAEITLDGILGEELRIRSICEIDIVNEFDKSYQSKASPIINLADHLKKISQ